MNKEFLNYLKNHGKVNNTNNSNIKKFRINGNEVTLEKFGNKLAFQNKHTKGPKVIAVPLMAAKHTGSFKKIKYDPENNGHTLRFLGFNKKGPYNSFYLNVNKINNKRLEKIIQGNLSNHKKYINSIPLTRLNKFNKGLAALGNAIITEKPRRNVRVIRTPNRKAFLRMVFGNNAIQYSFGQTNIGARGKGYGTFLRKLPIQIARNAGFKQILHRGVFNNDEQRKEYKKLGRNIPPSRFIVLKLGFRPINNMNSVLNL